MSTSGTNVTGGRSRILAQTVIHPSIHKSNTFKAWAKKRNLLLFRRKGMEHFLLVSNAKIYSVYKILEKDMNKAFYAPAKYSVADFVQEAYKTVEDMAALQFWNSLHNLKLPLELPNGISETLKTHKRENTSST